MTTPIPIRRLRAYPATDAGRLRAPQNEDSYALPPALTQEQDRDKGYLYVLADGMGGYQAGEVASAIVTQVLPAAYYADEDTNIPASLERAIASAERQIKADQQAHTSHAQMGSTVVAVVVRGNLVVVSNVGDSRCYRLRAGRLKLLSIDHSWVGEQVRNKVLTEQEAREHPYRSVLNRALGQPNASPRPDTITQDWQPGDRLLLCSDGLWDMLPDQQIAEILSKPDAAEAAKKLIDEANAAGGEDNITVVIITDDLSGPLPMAAPPGAGKNSRIILPLVAFALVTLCVGGGLLAALEGPKILGLDGSGGKDGGQASATPAPASAGNGIPWTATATVGATATLLPFITPTGMPPTKTPTSTKPPPTSTASSTATSSPTLTAVTIISETKPSEGYSTVTPQPTITPTPEQNANKDRNAGQICNYTNTQGQFVKCQVSVKKIDDQYLYVFPNVTGLKDEDKVSFWWSSGKKMSHHRCYEADVKNLRKDPHFYGAWSESKYQIDIYVNEKTYLESIQFTRNAKGKIEEFSQPSSPLCGPNGSSCQSQSDCEWIGSPSKEP